MKHIILFLLFAVCVTNANAQQKTLKELLYGGKLKKDSSGVIRKDDDLNSKIDTATKVIEPAAQKTVPVSGEAGRAVALPGDSLTIDASDSATIVEATTKTSNAPVKSNTKIWKEYTDSLISNLKAEVLTNKKLKKDTYFVTVDYEINTDGSVNIVNVVSTPENAMLQSEVRNRVELLPPQLAPVLDSTQQPRKVKRKHNFSVTKE